MDFVPEAYKADIETRHLRELLRYRASVVRMRASVKNKIHALLTKLNIGNPYSDLFGKGGIRYLENLRLATVYRQALDGHLTILTTLNNEIKKADERVERESAGSLEARLLESVPGIGRVLSLTILSEIGDINRFHSAKHLASFAGLVPSTSQSGGPAKHGGITHQGSAWLRWALCEAAMHVVRSPGPLRSFYLKQKKRKGNKIARVAVARKLCTYIYHMLKEGKDFSSVVSYGKSDLG
jgi:transposase